MFSKSKSSGGVSSGFKGRKGRPKGSKSIKGRPAKYNVEYKETDVSESEDEYVTCAPDVGLFCANEDQSWGRSCEDYAIRVLCNCGMNFKLKFKYIKDAYIFYIF